MNELLKFSEATLASTTEISGMPRSESKWSVHLVTAMDRQSNVATHKISLSEGATAKETLTNSLAIRECFIKEYTDPEILNAIDVQPSDEQNLPENFVWKHINEITADLSIPQAFATHLLEKVVMAYSEGRTYHNLLHISEMLQFAEEFKDEATDYNALRLAILGHDYVYDGVHGEDERQSADQFGDILRQIGVENSLITEMKRLVLTTPEHKTSDDDIDGMLLIDADLAILAAPFERYMEYTRGIRAEYMQYSDEQFARGRVHGYLNDFIEREKLYNHPAVREKLQERAKENMRREREELRKFLDPGSLR